MPGGMDPLGLGIGVVAAAVGMALNKTRRDGDCYSYYTTSDSSPEFAADRNKNSREEEPAEKDEDKLLADGVKKVSLSESGEEDDPEPAEPAWPEDGKASPMSVAAPRTPDGPPPPPPPLAAQVEEDDDGVEGLTCEICHKFVKGGLESLKSHRMYSTRCQQARGVKGLRKPCADCGKWIVDCDMSWSQHKYTCKYGPYGKKGNRKETGKGGKQDDHDDDNGKAGKAGGEEISDSGRSPIPRRKKVTLVEARKQEPQKSAEAPPMKKRRRHIDSSGVGSSGGASSSRNGRGGGGGVPGPGGPDSAGGAGGDECERVGMFLSSIADFLKSTKRT